MKKTVAAFALVLAALSGCSNEQEPGGLPPGTAGPVEVGVVTLAGEDVPMTLELPGRVVAHATAEVRPQVDGIVQEIAFDEARRVSKGSVLYRLDDRRFRAAVAAAEAALKKEEAATAAARSTFDRTDKLAATNAVSDQTLDDARSTLLQAEAGEDAARAELDAARIDLDNATITAPIDGIIGVSAVSVGSLVTTNQTDALATIRQIDPVYVDLVDSSANLLRIRDAFDSGRLGRDRGVPPPVTLTLENGSTYATAGEIKLADMVVSRTSGTFSMRATFANQQRVLLPGMFVRATVEMGSVPDAFLIPQRAVQRDDDGDATLFTASADGKAQLKKIITNGSLGNDWIVVGGVENGDRLIVDGFQKIADGTAIKPVAATIDDDGVALQTVAAPAESGNTP